MDVWKESINLVVDVYDITKIFPKDELYGLISQIRRTVVSVSSSITEVSGRE